MHSIRLVVAHALLAISCVVAPAEALAAGPPPCITVTPDSWVNVPFGSGQLSSTFDAVVEVTPAANNVDLIVGLSRERASVFPDISVTARLGPSGFIQALNGSAYASSSIPYTAGITYRLRFAVSIPSRVFSVYVTPGNGSEVLLGSGFAFRTAAGAPVRLENWVTTTTSGSGQACEFGAASFVSAGLEPWRNSAFLAQSNTLAFEWDATPSSSTLDTVMALSSGEGAAFADFACLVRFASATGRIEARNGSVYAPSMMPFSAGITYHFRLAADLPTHTYSVYVTPEGGAEQTLATNFAFRTEQAAVLQLDNFGVVTDSPSGATQIANFRLTAFTDPFTGPDGVVTDEFASTGAASLMWHVTSGELRRVTNRGTADASVFRMHSRSDIEGDYRLSFDLWTDGVGSQNAWNGVHVFLRHVSQRDLYYVSVNRVDQTAIIKRKVPCGPSNDGTYFNLTGYANFPWPIGARQRLSVTVRTQGDGGVAIEMWDDDRGVRILATVDRGGSNPNWSSGCTEGGRYGSASYPPLWNGGAAGIRSDDARIRIDNVRVTRL
jgi:hypothetical protein